MKYKLKNSNLWDFNKASFFMVVLPYIGFNWRELYDSIFFNVKDALEILLVLIFIEIVFKQLVKRVGKNKEVVSILFICFTVLFFYGNNIVIPIYEYITKSLHFYIKEKILFLLIGVLLLFIFHFLFVKKKLWKVLNIFLCIYFFVNVFSSRNLNVASIPSIDSIKNSYKPISNSASTIKNTQEQPLILIVMDEYSSPDELYKIVKDSSVYHFSNSLKNKGWEVRNSAYTYESSTIHSISSLFNFNLSKDSMYEKQHLVGNIIKKKMLNNVLLDSLTKKGVVFNNYGIFHIGNTLPLTQLYLYPTNFTERFLIRTAYAEEKIKSNNFKLKNLIKSNDNIYEHNAYILNHLPDLLKKSNKKSFTYVHLFIPHAPFYYGKEFPIRHIINFENYFLFWKFNNMKMESLLDSINKVGNFRIILTGDHGFRRNEHAENYHYSFTAFKGFDSIALKQIESIQDIGLLINASF